MDQIPQDEISFHPHSYGDPDGRLFSWRGELYRGISHRRTPFFREVFQKGVLQKLMEGGILIDSEPVGSNLEGYGMVLRHRRIPFVSYPHEWCAVMFRNAGIAYLDLVGELARVGLMLKDTHPWNLLFDGCQPVYVDLTSLVPITDRLDFINADKFQRYYIYPLLLMSAGQERIFRHLLPDYEGISRADVVMLTQKKPRFPFTVLNHGIVSVVQNRVPEEWRAPFKGSFALARSFLAKARHSQLSLLDSIERLKDELTRISLPVAAIGKSDTLSPVIGPATEQKLKQMINELHPRSILAIGNDLNDLSDFAELTPPTASQLVYFDRNSDYVSRLYYRAIEKKSPLLPLVIDFTDPTPSRGLSSHLSIAAAERLQCEMVIAMGLIKQVIMERHLRFDQIVHGLEQFSKRWLITDFMPLDSCEQSSVVNAWYTLDNFVAALRKKFTDVQLLSRSSNGHGLLLCQK